MRAAVALGSKGCNVSSHGVEQAMDASIEEQEMGQVLRVLGWTILAMSSITCVWIWTGWRAGSSFWFWFTCALGFLGSAVIAAGARLRARAATEFAAVVAQIGRRASEAGQKEEAPGPEDLGRRAA
jgi:hypothetical protein